MVAGVAFVVAQRHASHPMTPPKLFASRVFTVINVVTLFVYAALAGSMYFLAVLVASLTGTVLAAVPDSRSGVASGINNAVSRTAGLLAIAALPLLVGLSGDDYRIPHQVADAYRASMWWCAGWVLVGAALTFVGLRPDRQRR